MYLAAQACIVSNTYHFVGDSQRGTGEDRHQAAVVGKPVVGKPPLEEDRHRAVEGGRHRAVEGGRHQAVEGDRHRAAEGDRHRAVEGDRHQAVVEQDRWLVDRHLAVALVEGIQWQVVATATSSRGNYHTCWLK